jgi:putative phosphotransacetylase
MKKVIAEISARHLHISAAHAAKLFGKTYQLKKLKDLSQPGEFAATAQLQLIGPKGKIQAVRIVGPIRKQTQIELTLSDCRTLGIKPVIRVSGDLKGSPGGLIIKGPKGQVKLTSGVIVPQRHLHISKEDAKKWKIKNGQKLKAKVAGSRGLVFDEIVARVGNYQTRIHLDTDESNAAGLLSCSKIDLL